MPAPLFAPETLTVLPLFGAVMLESARRTVSEPGTPLKLAAGKKRRPVAEVRNRPELSESDVETLVQVPLLFHCQVPWEAVAALAVTTTPSRVLALVPPETLSSSSEKLPLNSSETVAPVGALAAGTRLRGHEFHYSTVVEQTDAPLAYVTDADGAAVAETGSRRGRVTGSYFHMIATAQ